jgi:hypothetical protein
LTPNERRYILEHNFDEGWDKDWNNQQFPDQGLTFPTIASKYGNMCDNEETPDATPPPELFNFDLILNSRKFKVVCDTLIRINREEDLADYPESKLNWCLEQCASYRMTCFCAYIGAHKEHRKWKMYHKIWMAEKSKKARNAIKADRVADRASGNRKDIGQITSAEIEEWILTNHTNEYKRNVELVEDWEENEKVFLELRDTLKDRGTHLQTLLRRVQDHIAPKSDGSPTG